MHGNAHEWPQAHEGVAANRSLPPGRRWRAPGERLGAVVQQAPHVAPASAREGALHGAGACVLAGNLVAVVGPHHAEGLVNLRRRAVWWWWCVYVIVCR